MAAHHRLNGFKPESALVDDCAFRTPRLDEFEEVVSKAIIGHKLTPLHRGSDFDCAFAFNGWKELCIFSMSFGRPLTIELDAEEADDRIGFSMTSKGSCDLLWKGRRYKNDGSRGLTFSSGPPKALLFGEDCVGLGMVMSRHRIAEIGAKLIGCDIGEPIEFEPELRLDDGLGRSWLRLVQYAAGEISNPHSFVRQIPAARLELEQTVLTGFLLTHTHTYSRLLHQPQRAAAPHHVRRAEAYIETHFSEPLSLADIAAEAGVSARSLQNGFQDFRQMSPMAFLRAVRLQHAHLALLKADPALASMAEIAVGNGFSHMGEFSRLYKRAYGVAPRETLLKKLRA
ncbi:AraC family transcriptional regulator [Microvirga sp. GCM10011540]|uniref:helix-turn-helix transcriptional regulator n=1 Tax=Microvirga sp. GCM10011540 TaxID=3317338 RepID=UPI003616A473